MSIPLSKLDLTPRPACPSRKIGYVSQREVRAFIGDSSSGRSGARAYRCPECPLWHVTTTMSGGERKRRATKGVVYRKAHAL